MRGTLKQLADMMYRLYCDCFLRGLVLSCLCDGPHSSLALRGAISMRRFMHLEHQSHALPASSTA